MGAAQRVSADVEWKRQHQALSALTDLGVTPTPGGAALTWHTSF
jgi:hypothetical protein